jgi:DNA (cytosine-5)-methyltransferase 1
MRLQVEWQPGMTYEVKVRVLHDTSGLFTQGDVTDRPCPAILVGPEGLNSRHYQVEYYLTQDPPVMKQVVMDKPAYRVPLMAEIAGLPWNGYKVVSTFSGCGGSCLGFKMPGFKVLWASEFIPAAQDTYRANHAGVIVDTRDIRQVRPEDILDATRLRAGELDVLEGSPPCASFSTAGKRQAGWGKVKTYSDSKQRVDDLFFEYARILKGLQPKVFVAENVSGLVKGTAKGYFLEILHALKDCEYRVKAKLLDAQWLGVPQMRQRVIFIGTRNDLGLQPAYPKPLPYRYTVRDALPWIRSFEATGSEFTPTWKNAAANPSDCISQMGNFSKKQSPFTLVEAETDINRYAIGREWDNLRQGEKSPKYLNLVKPQTDQPCPTICQSHGNTSTAGVVHPTEKRKFTITELKRICGFPDDFILTGSYAQQSERLGRAVPPVMAFHIAQTIRDEVLAKCAG